MGMGTVCTAKKALINPCQNTLHWFVSSGPNVTNVCTNATKLAYLDHYLVQNLHYLDTPANLIPLESNVRIGTFFLKASLKHNLAKALHYQLRFPCKFNLNLLVYILHNTASLSAIVRLCRDLGGTHTHCSVATENK